jgi:hypothetical protein
MKCVLVQMATKNRYPMSKDCQVNENGQICRIERSAAAKAFVEKAKLAQKIPSKPQQQKPLLSTLPKRNSIGRSLVDVFFASLQRGPSASACWFGLQTHHFGTVFGVKFPRNSLVDSLCSSRNFDRVCASPRCLGEFAVSSSGLFSQQAVSRVLSQSKSLSMRAVWLTMWQI